MPITKQTDTSTLAISYALQSQLAVFPFSYRNGIQCCQEGSPHLTATSIVEVAHESVFSYCLEIEHVSSAFMNMYYHQKSCTKDLAHHHISEHAFAL